MATYKQKRITKIIRFMDHLGIPVECGCNHKHKIVVTDFQNEGNILIPKKTLRLECVPYYDYLMSVQDIELNIQVDANTNSVKKFIIGIYVWLWKVWLN